MKYAVIIDAGSSGSRSFVYTWPDPQSYTNGLADSPLLETLIPIETMPLWVSKHQPGISSFQGRVDEIWKQHLQPLLKKAQDVVPPPEQPQTPVYFLATAGMRLLPEDDRAQILSKVCDLLQAHTRFLVPECSTHVAMIDGTTEGLYGWLGLNYLVHQGLSQPWNEFNATYGFLDMGGASAQLAFSVPLGASQHADDLHLLRIRTAGGAPVEWQVYVNTWLGFGANEARNRFRQLLTAEIGADERDKYVQDQAPVPLIDPCLPQGAVDAADIDGVAYVFQGNGDFTVCERYAARLLNADAPCDDAPCLFNGVHAPDFFGLDGQRFVGVSEFWYTWQDLLHTNGKYDHATLLPRIHEFCGSEWSAIRDDLHAQHIVKSDGKLLSEDDIKRACFKSTWVLTILSKGFEFPLQPDEPHREHRFLDGFQSAMEIDGAEISWTLGRAVLYASSQIAADPHAAGYVAGKSALEIGGQPVGFGAPHSSSFVPGGEVLAAPELVAYQNTRATDWATKRWSNAETLVVWLLILAVFSLGFARILLGSFAEVRDAFCALRPVKRLRRRLRRLLPAGSPLPSHAANMGYGYAFPRASSYPLTDFDFSGSEASSSLRAPSRAPSRVESRVNLNG